MKRTALAISLLFAGCQLAGTKPGEKPQVYALKYAESDYPARLVNSRQTNGKVYMHWLAYLVRSPDGGLTLIDCGFSDPALVKKFALRGFKPVSEILGQLQIMPQQIQTVILTHTHFDHALDVGLFTSANVYVHASEAAKPESSQLTKVFATLGDQNRLRQIQDGMQIGPALEAIHIAGHTRGSLVVRLGAQPVPTIFTGDECYFAEACHQGIGLPAAAAFDRNKNRAFIQSIRPDTRLLTGHEPHKTGGRWISPEIFLFD
ncbi:MBL fold metallo-hydrolase [Turneriella parva]|uniref:Metallo-beta-lactamase n=1 Tax=Turneriella parva (strain ATCC BAA-1111 / DSM 21527 / NCTC 11395 / H) TaxID=869212 RepID=I4B141_TURPD|nr:MBL fold metallo-hydrolase [Turneriella parva]AFM10998.1 metallo-beta-lactamase [Turneriella parva DSM 21527]